MRVRQELVPAFGEVVGLQPIQPRMRNVDGLGNSAQQRVLRYRLERIDADELLGQLEDYTIDHTGVTYLVGRDGKYLGFVPPQTTPERLAEVIRAQLLN